MRKGRNRGGGRVRGGGGKKREGSFSPTCPSLIVSVNNEHVHIQFLLFGVDHRLSTVCSPHGHLWQKIRVGMDLNV